MQDFRSLDFKMLAICLLIVFFATPSLACNGCSVKNFKLETCRKGTEDYIKLECGEPILTNDCYAAINCTRHFPKAIKSFKAKISASMNGIPVTLKYDDGCAELRNLESDNAYVKIIKSYPPPPEFPFECPSEPVNAGIVPLKFKIREDHKKMLKNLGGNYKGKVESSYINGVANDGGCFQASFKLDCGGLFRG